MQLVEHAAVVGGGAGGTRGTGGIAAGTGDLRR